MMLIMMMLIVLVLLMMDNAGDAMMLVCVALRPAQAALNHTQTKKPTHAK